MKCQNTFNRINPCGEKLQLCDIRGKEVREKKEGREGLRRGRVLFDSRRQLTFLKKISLAHFEQNPFLSCEVQDLF